MGCEVIKVGEATAIICGRKDHECDDKAGVILLRDGSRVEATDENRKKYWENGMISGESCACSICGRASIDNSPYM